MSDGQIGSESVVDIGPHRREMRRAYAYANLAVLLWSTNFILGRILRDDIGPFTLTAARFSIALAIFNILAARSGNVERKPGKQTLMLVAMGFTGVFAFANLLYSGLQRTTATNASLINGASPLIFGLLATVLLREQLRGRSLVGAVLSFTGVAIIISGGSLDALLRQRFNTGDLLVLASLITWGLYSVASRVVTRTRSVLSATLLSTWIGLPLLLPAALLEWQARPPHLTLPVILGVVYIAIFPSVIAFLAWNESIRIAGPVRATAFYNMLPVYGSILGVGLLGEPFAWAQLLGGALVIAGSLFAVWPDIRGGRPLPSQARS